MDADVLVIGAGLAGLNAARGIERAGLTPLVLESSDAIGGRVRTDAVDGFRVDRGFQLLNPAYPALRRAVDPATLALRPFGRGVAVRTGAGLQVLADPFRSPLRAGELARAGLSDASGAWGLARWLLPAMRGKKALSAASDLTLSESLDAAGVHGPLRTGVLEPFLVGVLADDEGGTSASFARWLAHWFALGTPSLPAQGMAALPAALRAALKADVRLATTVDALDRDGGAWVARTSGGSLSARAVVLAAGPVASAGLAGGAAPRMRGLATWWFAPDEAPTASTYLHVDGERGGPVVNSAVVSNVQPAYAPAGRHLVQASTLLGEGLAGEGFAGRAPSQADVRTHLGRLYDRSAQDWPVVAVHHVPHALPAIEPGGWLRTAISRDGLVVAGDQGDASIQGAMQSGQDAAAHVIGLLHG
ncbi:MAG TPA: FAD-dependent oxidoreductase [Propionibacteriaceae bacterium]|mgnify:FL=1|nr:FAD-dependent oxidoreductase [Propionibacteriaceae bacterium]